VFRLGTFFASVLDWDESLYLLVADQWLRGHAPYTVVWDNKPPGIYALFALALQATGRSILAVRALACIAVAVTCTAVFRIGALLRRDGWVVGLVAGGCYAGLSLNNGGQAANTEVFFAAPSVVALYLVLSAARSLPQAGTAMRLAWAGLLFGLALEIKYVAIFDVAVALLILALGFPGRARARNAVVGLGASVVAMLLATTVPFVLVTLLFRSTGHGSAYWAANFTANQARTLQQAFRLDVITTALRAELRSNMLPFLVGPLPVLGYLAVTGRLDDKEDRWFVRTAGLAVLATLGCLIVVFRTALYGHYFLQLAPWLALLAAFGIVRVTLSSQPSSGIRPPRWRLLVVAVALLLAQQSYPYLLFAGKQIYFRGIKGRAYWEDRPAAVAAYLAPRLRAGDAIYVVDDEPVIYFLTGARLPTRFVFPPFLVRRKELPDITGVAPLTELTRIMGERPAYVIKLASDQDPTYVADDQIFFDLLRGFLRRDYVLDRSIDGLDIFRRSPSPP
jgi:hypothetical protein